jgi:hypothetical protein
MEIEFRKLENNFAKSEQIRKQQKKIIENLRTKNWATNKAERSPLLLIFVTFMIQINKV